MSRSFFCPAVLGMKPGHICTRKPCYQRTSSQQLNTLSTFSFFFWVLVLLCSPSWHGIHPPPPTLIFRYLINSPFNDLSKFAIIEIIFANDNNNTKTLLLPFNSEKCYTEIVMWVNVITLTLEWIPWGSLLKRNTICIFPVLTKWPLSVCIPSLKKRYRMHRRQRPFGYKVLICLSVPPADPDV